MNNEIINFNNFYDFMYNKNIDFTIAKRYNENNYSLLSYDYYSKTEDAINEYIKLYPEHKDIKNLLNNIYYSDEYCTCDDCGCICEINSYNYYKECYFNKDYGYCQCSECMKEYNKEEYIEYHKNNPNRIIKLLTVEEMEENGWQKLSKISENGLYGERSDPKKQYETFKQLYQNYDLIFVRTDENMFMIEWIIMGKEKEEK